MSDIQYLDRPDQPRIAYVYTPPAPGAVRAGSPFSLPLIVFLGGFRSDMEGTKALFLEEQCRRRGQAFLRLDYSGHGVSEGQFEDGSISQWKQDAMDVIDHVTGGGENGQMILVGSSMGGWIALSIALEWGARIKGVVGIAAAPDFTIDLWNNRLDDSSRAEISEKGFVSIPNAYDERPYIFTKKLFEDGKNNLILDRVHTVPFSVTLVQGKKDDEVPWQTASRIENVLDGAPVDIVLISDGDHRLSRPEDLDVIGREVQQMSEASLQDTQLK